jgi:hypothetical protein
MCVTIYSKNIFIYLDNKIKMGSGSSRKRTVTRHTQVTSPPNPRVRSPSPQLTTRTTHHHKRRYSSSPKLHIHRLQSNSSLANYANIWERDGKVKIFLFLLKNYLF